MGTTRHNEAMVDVLTFLGRQTVTLDEVNGPYVWLIVSDYAFDTAAESVELLAALISNPAFVTDVHVPDRSHGPYLVDSMSPYDFEPTNAAGVEQPFADWISNEGPVVPLDADSIIVREVRSRLVGEELFLLKSYNRSGTLVLSENAETLGGWEEALVVDRIEGRLRTIAGGSD